MTKMTETTYTPDQRPTHWTRSASGAHYATTAQGQYLITTYHTRAKTWTAVRIGGLYQDTILCENQSTMREARACVEWDRWHRLSAADVYDAAIQEYRERTTLAVGNPAITMPAESERTIVQLAIELVELGGQRSRLLATGGSVGVVRETTISINTILAEIERRTSGSKE